MLARVPGVEAHDSPLRVTSPVKPMPGADRRGHIGLRVVGHVFEWYGYAADDQTHTAATSAVNQSCPFVPPDCTKAGGACSVHTGQEIVSVCPKRFYFDNFRVMREIADEAFAQFPVARGVDGLPTLVPGNTARATAAQTGQHQVGAFGQGWANSGEIKLPPAMPGGARYSVDFVLVVVDPAGDLQGFVPVEVQSIDTTNTYAPSIAGLAAGRQIVASNFGMNWENVNKRILPQLIVKGLMLQGERLCTTGIYFVTPESVFQRIMLRLGGLNRLRQIPQQPATITFLRFDQDVQNHVHGAPVPLRRLNPVTISTSDMSLAFISPENLPAAGAYEQKIAARL